MTLIQNMKVKSRVAPLHFNWILDSEILVIEILVIEILDSEILVSEI